MEVLLMLLVIVLIVLLVLVLKKLTEKDIDNQKELLKMQTQLQNELHNFQNSVIGSMRTDLNTLNQNTNDRLFKMEHNVNEQLNKGFKTTSDVVNEMLKQVVKIDQTQEQLKILSSDITALHTIFNDKKNRGVYGEIELYSLLEASFGDDHHFYAKQYKLVEGKIVDAVIFGNDALGMIPIDSKFPLENFRRINDENLSDNERNKAVTAFKNDVKKHIDDISSKYIIPGVTSEFAYMFIPAEAIFSYIHANLEELVEYSYRKKVYIVSPTTLMAYITAIKALYLDQKKNEQVKDIQLALVKLSDEFNRFKIRYEKVMKDVNGINNDLNSVLITADKIEKQFRKIEQVKIEEDE